MNQKKYHNHLEVWRRIVIFAAKSATCATSAIDAPQQLLPLVMRDDNTHPHLGGHYETGHGFHATNTTLKYDYQTKNMRIMKQNLRFLLLTLLCAVVSTAWGQEVTLDFTDGTWGFPTSSKVVEATSYTNSDGYTITVEGTSGNGFRVYTNPNYFLFGKQGASITLPAFDFDVEKIEVGKGSSQASTGVKMNIFVGDNAVSTETTGSHQDNTYQIAEGYQAAGNVYKLKVTSNHNAQLTYIKIYKKGGDKYYVAGTWTDWADGKIEMTKNANGTYTLADQELAAGALFKIIKVADGSDPVWCGGNADGDKYWITIDNHTDITMNVGGGQNFYIDIAGTWTFTVDPTGNTPKLTVGGWPEWEYYLKGDFNEWEISDSYKFSEVEATGEYTLNKSIAIGQKFKIYGIRGSEEKWFGAVSNGDFYVEENLVGEELSLTTENGGENFYMDLSNKNSYWTLDFDPANMTLVLGNFISDVAKLPFAFDGGRSDIEETPGLTTTGLDTDYGSSPKLKFSAANNALILHFNEQPGTLSYNIKGNSFSGGVFEVQTSEDGENYTTLKSYNSISGSTTGQNDVFDNLGENVRYIKWLYKTKSSGNVALGNIKLGKYVAPQPYTLTITGNENAEIFVFYNDPDSNYPEIEDGDEVLATSEVLVSVSAEEGYQIESVTVTDGEGQNVTLTEEEEGISWTFIMPSSNVTVACTVSEIPEPSSEEWVLTSLADLTEDDIFVIVGNNGDNYAMSNDKGTTPPDAVTVGVVNNKIITPVADRIKWNISGNATDGYTFYPNGDTENWLYLKDKSTNKGVYVGEGAAANSVFTLSDGYLYNAATERYVGIYNSSDWRCYTSTSTNIGGQTFGFYKLVKHEPESFSFSISDLASDASGTCYATISALGDGYFKVEGEGVEVRTVEVRNGKLVPLQVFEEGAVIPGDGAYLVAGPAGDYSFPAAEKVEDVDLTGNMLYGGSETISKTEMEQKHDGNYKFYMLSTYNGKNVGFYYGATNGAAFDSAAHKAYLAVLQESGSTPVNAYLFDGTTSIDNVAVVNMDADAVYSLSGVKMNTKQLPKGIYIVNGQKMVVK